MNGVTKGENLCDEEEGTSLKAWGDSWWRRCSCWSCILETADNMWFHPGWCSAAGVSWSQTEVLMLLSQRWGDVLDVWQERKWFGILGSRKTRMRVMGASFEGDSFRGTEPELRLVLKEKVLGQVWRGWDPVSYECGPMSRRPQGNLRRLLGSERLGTGRRVLGIVGVLTRCWFWIRKRRALTGIYGVWRTLLTVQESVLGFTGAGWRHPWVFQGAMFVNETGS